jgi:hypothetical protein
MASLPGYPGQVPGPQDSRPEARRVRGLYRNLSDVNPASIPDAEFFATYNSSRQDTLESVGGPGSSASIGGGRSFEGAPSSMAMRHANLDGPKAAYMRVRRASLPDPFLLMAHNGSLPPTLPPTPALHRNRSPSPAGGMLPPNYYRLQRQDSPATSASISSSHTPTPPIQGLGSAAQISSMNSFSAQASQIALQGPAPSIPEEDPTMRNDM